jgi:hypothetical protein
MKPQEYIDITRNLKFGDIIKIKYVEEDENSLTEKIKFNTIEIVAFVLGIYYDTISMVEYTEDFDESKYDENVMFDFGNINVCEEDIISIDEKYDRVLKLKKIKKLI